MFLGLSTNVLWTSQGRWGVLEESGSGQQNGFHLFRKFLLGATHWNSMGTLVIWLRARWLLFPFIFIWLETSLHETNLQNVCEGIFVMLFNIYIYIYMKLWRLSTSSICSTGFLSVSTVTQRPIIRTVEAVRANLPTRKRLICSDLSRNPDQSRLDQAGWPTARCRRPGGHSALNTEMKAKTSFFSFVCSKFLNNKSVSSENTNDKSETSSESGRGQRSEKKKDAHCSEISFLFL